MDLTKSLGETPPILVPGVTITPDPHRFDPYEALDTITRALEDLYTGPNAKLVPETIRGEVSALRAYITGMEHG